MVHETRRRIDCRGYPNLAFVFDQRGWRTTLHLDFSDGVSIADQLTDMPAQDSAYEQLFFLTENGKIATDSITTFRGITYNITLQRPLNI